MERKTDERTTYARIAAVGLTLLMTFMVVACTNMLFIIKGQGNQLRNENNTEVKTDSVTVKIDVK
jgi:hypothetical protein